MEKSTNYEPLTEIKKRSYFGTRKIIALFSTLILGFALIYSIIKGEKDYVLMLVPTFSGAVSWYFAKSTALDTPKQ